MPSTPAASRGHVPAPLCECGVSCARLISRTERNPDRPFFRCGVSKPGFSRSKGCDFFAWVDEMGGEWAGHLPRRAFFATSPTLVSPTAVAYGSIPSSYSCASTVKKSLEEVRGKLMLEDEGCWTPAMAHHGGVLWNWRKSSKALGLSQNLYMNCFVVVRHSLLDKNYSTTCHQPRSGIQPAGACQDGLVQWRACRAA